MATLQGKEDLMPNDKFDMTASLQDYVNRAKSELETADTNSLQAGLLNAIIRLDGIGTEFVDEVIESDELNAAIELSAAAMAQTVDVFGPIGSMVGVLRSAELLAVSSTTALYCFLLGTVYAREDVSND